MLIAVGVFCVPLFVSSADAQINAGRRLALVVGNTAYKNVTPLKNAVRDADAVSEILNELGFEVVLLKDAKASQIEAAVERIKEQADDAEATLFYYSGHGFQMRGANYLVPVDAVMRDRSKIAQETLRLDAIIASLQSKGRQTLVFLDACRNDPLPAAISKQTSGQGLAQVQTGKGTFVAFATQPGNVTADGAGDRSPFTNAFVEHVGTPGISISDMMIRIRNTVEDNTLQRQTPWDQSSLRSQFYFNPADEEQEELSEETLELLASLDPALRKKFAERFGIELPEEEELDVPVETVRPRLSIGPVKVQVKPKPTVATAEAKPEQKKPTAPRLALSPALGGKTETKQDEADGGDLGVSGTKEIAQPNFRPAPAGSEQEVAILLPSDRRPARSTSQTNAPVLVPRQDDSINRVRKAPSSTANRIQSANPDDTDQSTPPVTGGQSVPVPDDGDRAASGSDEIASLRPVERGAVTNSSESVMRSVPSADQVGSGVQDGGQIVLQPLTSSLATRIVGQDVTPVPDKPKEETIQLAALNPQDSKPDTSASITPEDVPADLPLAIQKELYRLGCYRNARDGIWGNNSAKALFRYYLLKKESPDLVDPDAQLYAKLSAEEKVICERTEPAKPRRKVARARPNTKKPVSNRSRPARTKRSRPKNTAKKRAPSRKKTARSSGGGSKRIKKIKKLGGAFR